MTKRLFGVLLISICILPLDAAVKKKPRPPVASKKTNKKLIASIDKLLDSDAPAQAHWGMLAVDLQDGRVIYARNEHRLFAPASNTKLFTTATALETLGPQFKFRTTVESAAPPDAQGVVAGDLVLVGRGDPNLSSRVLPYKDHSELSGSPLASLDRLVEQLVAARVRTVDGDVIGDDTYFVFERYGEGWTVDDTLWSYGAPVSALTVADNTMTLSVDPSEKAGDYAGVRIEPFGNYFKVENRIRTAEKGGGRRVLVNREPGSRVFELWGRIGVGDATVRESLAIDDPADLAARYLRDALIARGITVKGSARARHRRMIDAISPTEAVPVSPFVLATIESLPLADDLKVINKISQNLHAEMALRTISRERTAKDSPEPPGSVAAGLTVVKEFLKKAGLSTAPDPGEFTFLDGCGLSRGNLVAPAATVRLLTYMNSSPNRDIWVDTLPVAGTDGSLTGRLKTTCTVNQVEAKTGTLRHVAALSGYMTTSRGRRLAFSLMVNNHNMATHDATDTMDKVLDEICKAE